ncbi:TIGR04283 family arsenosugar biosynthesis glycosyltransferase [Mariprofundus ferrooxydans]|uniref:TIGR04283 family arsenosugar biosynthesis glycosyltransferase n=1 Tax=Mariprofundus ferrooxydans TaxID=314344 RepID=UPI003B8A730F
MERECSIAVVVPVLNEQALLPALLERLHALPADEVVIVDGGSTDGTCQMLENSTIRWISSAAGRANQMNAGASVTDADILLFIHSDTEINSSCFTAVKRAMQDAATVAGRFDIRFSGGHPLLRMIAWFINTRSRLTLISTGDQCLFVRRSHFEATGGFPSQPLMEDIEFTKRLKRQGHIACLREQVTTSSRRWETHGILKTILLMWRLRLLYFFGVPAGDLASMYRQVR